MQLETTARAIDSFRRRPGALRLECGVQHYDWGDPDAIPALLHRPNPGRQPYAELWAGAHPDLPSTAIIDDIRVPLDQLIREARVEILGTRVATRFGGEFPFLMKVLAARKPLSIQAHPNRRQALLGFGRENSAGLPLEASTRNYRDANHKPELLAAITDFFALRGFRPLAKIAEMLKAFPELASLAERLRPEEKGLAAFYGHVMGLHQAAVNALLDPLIERLGRRDQDRPYPHHRLEHWVLRADREFSVAGRRDRGLLSMFLLNLVHLRPGQAIFLPAGQLHSYLEGVGVEIMANSNNVLRGGLTRKHVDVDELLHILSFHGESAQVLEPEVDSRRPGLSLYPTPAGEFSLSRLRLQPGQDFVLGNGPPTLALVTAGEIEIGEGASGAQRVGSGEAILVPAHQSLKILAEDVAELWQAQVPRPGVS